MKNLKNIILTAIITVLAGIAIKMFDGNSSESTVNDGDSNQPTMNFEQMLSSTDLSQLIKAGEETQGEETESEPGSAPEESEDFLQSESQRDVNTVTVGGVTFPMSREYEIVARQQLGNNAEACMIAPTWKPSEEGHRLILKIHPNVLQNVNGMTDEEVGNMLYNYVNALAGVLARKPGITLDREYKVHFDNNADGSYHPHSYSYLNWKESNGLHVYSYTEAALVNGYIVSGSAISPDDAEVKALSDILWEAVAGAGN